jgi:hypothetical protein
VVGAGAPALLKGVQVWGGGGGVLELEISRPTIRHPNEDVFYVLIRFRMAVPRPSLALSQYWYTNTAPLFLMIRMRELLC